MSPYYFVCSIGPVQGFIAAARSSRDLTYGSILLNELARLAAQEIAAAEKSGVNALVFPAPESNDDLKNKKFPVSNKVVGIIETHPEKMAEAIEQRLRTFLLEKWEQEVEKKLGGKVDAALARRQIEDLLEFYWAAEPLEDEEKYPEVRERCEAILRARKATRNFKPYAGVSRFKSSIDGWREHVLNDVPDGASSPTEEQMNRYKSRSGELLSGIDLLKRWGGLKLPQEYHSTGHMAALPFAKEIGLQNADSLCRELEDRIENAGGRLLGKGDYGIFFPAEVRSAFSNKKTSDKAKVERVLQKHNDIMSRYKRRPAPYYALLLADGDGMGKVIDAQKKPETHRELSKALSGFAQQVPGIVKAHEGVLVYSGGDDILAYLPLHTALKCVAELADTFKKAMQGFTYTENGETKSSTLSAGLVIVHYLEPLREALSLVRASEKQAKSVDGKNALAITLNKRSGADRTVKANLPTLIKRLNQIVAWWMDGTLSKGTAYELERLARDMGNVLPDDALRHEAIRILKRKREAGGGQDVKKEVLDTVKQWLDKMPLGELALEMIVAGEFARAKELAKGEAKK